jgi:hypothetical protein
LAGRKLQLEKAYAALQAERDTLADRLAAYTLTDEQIATLKDYGDKLSSQLPIADQSFGIRRGIIELLDLQVTLATEGPDRVIYIHGKLGEERFELSTTQLK